MAFAPWNMLVSGRLRTDAEEAAREADGTHGRTTRFHSDWRRTPRERAMVGVLEEVAREVGVEDIRAGRSLHPLHPLLCRPAALFVFPHFVWLCSCCVVASDVRFSFAVAIAYHLQKQPYVFPLVGGNKTAQLLANVHAVTISLSDDQIKKIEGAAEFEVGFPGKYIVSALPFLCRSVLLARWFWPS